MDEMEGSRNPLGLPIDLVRGVSYFASMLTLTDSAVKHLVDIIGGQDDPAKGLRIYIEKGGCAGLSYEMKLDLPKPEDTLVERDGARLMVDAESLTYLDGSMIDYCDDLSGTGFQIKNPNAARSCGCGTSFEAAPKSEV